MLGEEGQKSSGIIAVKQERGTRLRPKMKAEIQRRLHRVDTKHFQREYTLEAKFVEKSRYQGLEQHFVPKSGG